jgi:DNA (cytosine-5)-methyltransferase 1
MSEGKKKILNLYAGIGGNRKLWGDDYEITAVEYNEHIAKVYTNQFPNDKMIIGDAHQCLLEHFSEYDIIWSSPPCPSHSRMCFAKKTKEYIDIKLYQEILLLKSWFKGKFVVENVIPYYEPLIKPNVILGRHLFWTNFPIAEKEFKNIDISRSNPDDLLKERGIDMSIFDVIKDVPENRSMLHQRRHSATGHTHTAPTPTRYPRLSINTSLRTSGVSSTVRIRWLNSSNLRSNNHAHFCHAPGLSLPNAIANA